ncbi:MAG: adenosine kinase [Acidimicrobiales bacterium]
MPGRAEQTFDVVGVGNAIVDVITHADDAFLTRQGLEKGAMTLVDSARAEQLYAAMPPGIEASGGSAANTMAGLASFGSRAAYIGKVRDDQLGAVFGHDIRAVGVSYEQPAALEGPPTARCLIVVTPDAERTMSTCLGISNLLAPDDVDEALVASARVVYCEGYLWDVESAKAAIRKAMAAGRASGAKVALTLSDSFCVDRHRDEFLDLIEDQVDILFANTAEILSLYEVDDVDTALERVRGHCEIACVTRSELGSVIVNREAPIASPAWAPGPVVDTTGAGDLFAAGFLHAYCAGLGLAAAGRYGALAAGEVITHVGPRPEVNLRELARRQL